MLFGDACIDESMRLATIVGSISYHVPSGKSVELKSHTLKGPIIFMMAHSHWYDDPSVFPNPDQFLPERWMKNENGSGNSSVEVTAFARSVFKPFGDGRHICFGMKLARLVMHANLYCFASKETRRIEFDHEKVVIEHGLFPEKKVSENFVGRVVS